MSGVCKETVPLTLEDSWGMVSSWKERAVTGSSARLNWVHSVTHTHTHTHTHTFRQRMSRCPFNKGFPMCSTRVIWLMVSSTANISSRSKVRSLPHTVWAHHKKFIWGRA
jgi:hypothetical protein